MWLDDPRPRAGRTVPLKVLLRTYRGEEIVRTLPIEIPANASGTLSVMVSDGARLGAGRAARSARSPQPRSVAADDRALNKARRNNTLYVKLLGSDAGAVVNGELLSSLPPSVLGVLEADRNGGNFNPLHSATLGEWELPTEHAVSGVADADDHRLAELTPAVAPYPASLDMLTHAAAASLAAAVVSPARVAAAPRLVAEVLPGRDPGRLPEGRRREPVDRQPRPADARPGDRAGLRDAGAVSLDDGRRGPTASLFVGTGNEGKVFRVDAQGKGVAVLRQRRARGARARAGARTAASTSAPRPTARSTRSIATAPRRRSSIRTTSTSGRWPSTRKGNVFAGTGDKGVIYKITPDGKGAPFYKTKATHATALAFDKAGNLLVGTGSPGRCCAIDRRRQGVRAARLAVPGDPRAALRRQGHAVRRRAERPRRSGGARRRSPTDARRSPDAAIRSRAGAVGVRRDHVDRRSSTSAAARDPAARRARIARSPKGAVYRITPDGVWDQLWESREDSPYDLTFDPNGALIVGTGNKGKIYRLDGDPLRPTLLARASAQQVTAFHKDARGRLYYATANPGQAVPAVAGARRRAAPTSRKCATRRWSSTWGAISWRGTTPAGSRVEMFTRSGNTETPDDTWSAWSAAYTNAEGSPITSPKARYLQWRAVLTGKGDGPVLTSVTAAYLQRNLRPQVRSITVHPPGIVFQKPFTTGEPELAGFDDQTTPERKLAAAAAARSRARSSALGRRTYQKGLQTLVWRADDENDDDLRLRRAVPPRGRDGVEDAARRRRPSRSSSGTRRRCPTAPTS